MANDNSIVTIIPIANETECDNAMACFYGDDPGSPEISVRLSTSGSEPATHLGAANFVTGAQATALKDWPNGTLPTPVGNWVDYGLDATSALAAGAVMVQSVMTGGNFNTLAMTNFNATIQSLGLQKII